MGQTIPVAHWYAIGDSFGSITRRAVSYTPAAAMTLKHFSFVAVRHHNHDATVLASTLDEVTTITWEIRTAVATNKPGTAASTLLTSGTFDWRYTSAWKLSRPIKYSIVLPTPLALTASTQYWFVLKMTGDDVNARYPLSWISTYETGAASEVVATVYSSEYTVADGWTTGDNTYNLTLYVLDAQAGSNWHVVINGVGYMQPDKMRGYRCEQASSGLAQSRGGQSEYSQLRYPYSNLSQDSWLTGSGQLVQDDPNAFLYSMCLDTLVEHQMSIGPEIHMTGMVSTDPCYEPIATTTRTLPDMGYSTATAVASYVAQKFTAPTGGITATVLSVRVNNTNWPPSSAVSLALYTNVGGSPGVIMGSWVALGYANKWHWRDATVNQALTSATDYWLVVKTSQTWGTLPEHSIAYDQDGSYAGGAAKYSTNGTTWTAITGHSMMFQINHGGTEEMGGDVVKLFYGLVAGSGTLYAAAGSQVYKWTESTGYWTTLTSGLTTTATDLICFDDKLIACQGYDYPMRLYNGTTWSDVEPETPTDKVTNGGFADTTGWTENSYTTFSSEGSGQAGNCAKVLCKTNASWAFISQAITLVVGTRYRIRCWHKNGSGTNEGHIKVGLTADGSDYYASGALNDATWTEYTTAFEATSTTAYVTLVASDEVNAYSFFDTVSVEEASGGKYLHIGKGYLWASTEKNEIRRTNDYSTWSAGVTIGEPMYGINAMVNYQGRLLVGKEDGIWEVDDQDLSREYLLFREHADPSNCLGWAVWSGMLFIPVQNSVWRWQGSQYREVGPTDKRAGPTHDWPNKISRMCATASHLIASCSPVVSTGWSGVVMYNGVGWHHPLMASRINRNSLALCVTTELGTAQTRIWWAEGGRVTYAKYPTFTNNRYDWTSADFNLTGASYVSSWWDGGLKDALKFWNRFTMIADIPVGTSIDVYAARDGADWASSVDFTHLGELTAQTLSDNGEYVLMFPDGMVAKCIQLVFILSTTDNSKTPRIKAYNVESIVRQPPVYSYTFRILLADNITKMDTSTETVRTANDMWEELQRANSQNAPIIVSFPFKSVRGMLSYLKEETLQFKADGMGNETWERTAVVSLIEAT